MAKKQSYEELKKRVRELEKEVAKLNRMVEKLREASRQFSVLVEAFPDAIYFKDAEGRHLVVNKACAESIGLGKEKIIGKTNEQLLPPDLAAQCLRSDEETIKRRKPTRFEEEMTRDKGRKVFLETIKVPFVDDKANITGLVGISRDITDRKRAEEALKTEKEKLNNIVRGIGAGLSLLDADTRIIWCNDILRKWFGPDAKILGKHCFELYDLKNPQEECAALLTLSTGKVERGEAFGHTIKGEERYFQVIATPIRNEAGRIVQLLELLLDITERKRDEDALRQKEAQLEIKAKNLEEANTALRVLLKRREEDKEELEEKVLENVRGLVLPYLEKLKKTSSDANQISYISILESNLNDITSPFSRTLSSKYLGLTPTEIRVANLIKDGKTTKEIAEFMNVSGKTVETHRDNIRKKLGIKHKKANLRTHLSSLQ